MKRVFKIIGWVLTAIFVFIVGLIGVLWVTGAFNPKNIELDTIDFTVTADGDNIESTTVGSTQLLLVKDTFQTSMNFAPENATNKIIRLKIDVGEDVVKVPSQVVAGEQFTIEVLKDADGKNIGGEVQISAYDINNQTKATQDLTFFVDTDVTGLKFTGFNEESMLQILYDDEEETSVSFIELATSSAPIPFQIIGDPLKSINPNNTGDVYSANVNSFFKNIEDIQVSNTSVVSVTKKSTNTWVTSTSGYYTAYDYELNTVGTGSTTITAKMLPNYQMYIDYHAYLSAYNNAGQRFDLVRDLAKAFIEKYESYILARNTEDDKIQVGNEQLNGEELIAKIRDNSVEPGEIYFATEHHTYFELCVNFMYVSASMEVSVTTGTVQNIEASDAIYQVKLFDNNITYNVNSLASRFGLAVIPTISTNNLDDLLQNIEVNSLVLDRRGSSSQYTFENYRNNESLETLVNLLNNNNETGRITNRSNVFGMNFDDGERYLLGEYVDTNLTQNTYLNIVETGTGANRQWSLSIYDAPPTDVELYLHFSLTERRYSEMVDEEGETQIIPYTVVYEAVVQVSVTVAEPDVSDIVYANNKSIPEIFSTSSNTINGITNTYTSDIANTTASEAFATLRGFSYNTLRYMVLKSEALCADGSKTVIDVKKNPDGTFVEYSLGDNVYYEIADSLNGVLNIKALNVSNVKETEAGSLATKEYIPIRPYVFIIKTDINGDPVLDSDGNYQDIAHDRINTSFIVRSFVENMYFYRVDKEGNVVISNTAINGDKIVLYNDKLVVLQETNNVAVYFDGTISSTLNYDTVVASCTEVINIDHNIYPIVDEQSYMFALNYIVNSSGQFVSCSEQDNEQNCVNALYDALHDVMPFGSVIINCDLGINVTASESGSNVDMLAEYGQCDLEDINREVININFTCPDDTVQTFSVTNSPVSIIASVQINPQYIVRDESQQISFDLEGYIDEELSAEDSLVLDKNSDAVDIFTVNVGGDLHWWFNKDVESTTSSSTDINLKNPEDYVSVAYSEAKNGYVVTMGAISFVVKVPDYADKYYTEEEMITILQNFAYNSAIEWTVKIYDDSTGTYVTETATGTRASDFATIVVTNGVPSLNLVSGTETGQKLRIEATLYSYETSDTSNFLYGENYYRTKHLGSFDITLYREDAEITVYAFNAITNEFAFGDDAITRLPNSSANPLIIKGNESINLIDGTNTIVRVSVEGFTQNSSANWEITSNYSNLISLTATYAGSVPALENVSYIEGVSDGSKTISSVYLNVASVDNDETASLRVSAGSVRATIYIRIIANVTVTTSAAQVTVDGVSVSLYNSDTTSRTLTVYDSWKSVDLTKVFSITEPTQSKISFNLGETSFMSLGSGSTISTQSGTVDLMTILNLGRVYNRTETTMTIEYYTLGEDGRYNDEPIEYSRTINIVLMPTIQITATNRTEDSAISISSGSSYNLIDNGIITKKQAVVTISEIGIVTERYNTEPSVGDLVNLTIVDNDGLTSMDTNVKGQVNTTFDNSIVKNSVRVQFVALDPSGNTGSSMSIDLNTYIYLNIRPNLVFETSYLSDTPLVINETSNMILENYKNYEKELYGDDDKTFKFMSNLTDLTTRTLVSASIEYYRLSPTDNITYEWVTDTTNILSLDMTTDGGYITSLSVKKIGSVRAKTEYRIVLTPGYDDAKYLYISVEPDITLTAVYPVGGTQETVLIGQSFALVNSPFALASDRVALQYTTTLGMDTTSHILSDEQAQIVLSRSKYTFEMYMNDISRGYVSLSSTYATVDSSGVVTVNQIPSGVSTIYAKVTLIWTGSSTVENYIYYAIRPVTSSQQNTTGAITLSKTVSDVVAGVSTTLQDIVGTSSGADFAIVQDNGVIDGVTSYTRINLNDNISFLGKSTITQVKIYFYNSYRMFSDNDVVLTVNVQPDIQIERVEGVTRIASNISSIALSDLIKVSRKSGSSEAINSSDISYSVTQNKQLYDVNSLGTAIEGKTYTSSSAILTIRTTYQNGYYVDTNFTVFPNAYRLIDDSKTVQSGINNTLTVVAPYGLGNTKTVSVGAYSNPQIYNGLNSYGSISGKATVSYTIANNDYVIMDGSGNLTIYPVNTRQTITITAVMTYSDGVKYNESLVLYVDPNISSISQSDINTTDISNGDTLSIVSSTTSNTLTYSLNGASKTYASFVFADNISGASVLVHIIPGVYSGYTIEQTTTGYNIYLHKTTEALNISIPVYIDFTGSATSTARMYTSDLLRIRFVSNVLVSPLPIMGAGVQDQVLTLSAEDGNEFVLTDAVSYNTSTDRQVNLLRCIAYTSEIDTVVAGNYVTYNADTSRFVVSFGQVSVIRITIYLDGDTSNTNAENVLNIVWNTEMGTLATYTTYITLADAKNGVDLSQYFYYYLGTTTLDKSNIVYVLGTGSDEYYRISGKTLTYITDDTTGHVNSRALVQITDGGLTAIFVVCITDARIIYVDKSITDMGNTFDVYSDTGLSGTYELELGFDTDISIIGKVSVYNLNSGVLSIGTTSNLIPVHSKAVVKVTAGDLSTVLGYVTYNFTKNI